MANKEIIIPGGEARAFEVQAGDYIKVIDIEGKQVADLIALSLDNLEEYLSTAHTRTMSGHIDLRKGQTIFSNYRLPVLEFVEDTVGVHDTLYPCCDPMRYKLDFGVDKHRNCRENFVEALEAYGIEYWRVPDPVNLFQNTPVDAEGNTKPPEESISKAGDYVIFKALKNLVISISACPMDLTPLNGYKVTDIKAQVSKDKEFSN